MNDEYYMQQALDAARQGVKCGQTPFGACIVKDDKIIVATHNKVWQNTDITAHAEIVAIREACRILNTIDLSGCVIYSTTEPCPMCFAAIHWARISRIVFGAVIDDAHKAGFSELSISNLQMKEIGQSDVIVEGEFMRPEAQALFNEWKSSAGRPY